MSEVLMYGELLTSILDQKDGESERASERDKERETWVPCS